MFWHCNVQLSHLSNNILHHFTVAFSVYDSTVVMYLHGLLVL